MPRNPSAHLAFSAMAAALALFPITPASSQDAPMVWQFYERDDDQRAGQKISDLILGVPETDNVQVTGNCRQAEAGEDALVSMVFGADIGSKKEGDQLTVLFTGGGFQHTLQGTAYGTGQEEGVSGIAARLTFDDPLWTAMQEKDELDYLVKGHRASNLKLKGGNSTIRRFLETCESYSRQPAKTARSGAESSSRSTASTALLAANSATRKKAADSQQSEAAATSNLTEKQAFESAKELGTLEAWEAFLVNYPKGFYADLARAYVRKIGNQETKPASTTQPSKAETPAPQPKQLSTVDVGPGSKPWRTMSYSMDEGNTSARAAAVETDGVELLFYCNRNKKLSGILREADRGVYPQFDERIAQGLANRRKRMGNSADAYVRMQFSNDNAYSVSAAVQEMNGEVSLGYLVAGGGFNPQGKLVEDLMASSTLRIAAPPFAATFQMSNSRKSICSVLSQCGAKASGCGSSSSASTSGSSKKSTSSGRCGKGKVWLEGKCINRNEVASYCGPGYRRKGSKCVPGAYQAPKNPPKLDKRCPPGMIWELGGCTHDD